MTSHAKTLYFHNHISIQTVKHLPFVIPPKHLGNIIDILLIYQ